MRYVTTVCVRCAMTHRYREFELPGMPYEEDTEHIQEVLCCACLQRESVAIPIPAVQDVRLSYMARGILAVLHTCPLWPKDAAHLAAQSPRNVPQTVEEALQELARDGYVTMQEGAVRLVREEQPHDLSAL